MCPIHSCRKEAGDVFIAASALVRRMYKAVELAELKLEHPPYFVLSGNLTNAFDNLQSVLNASLMIVGEVKHKQVVEFKVI